jgi:hypothetical protein
MPSPEQGPGFRAPDHQPPQEGEPTPYYRAARFEEVNRAASVYHRAQDAIHRTACDLSAYRFLLDQVSHVAVLGAPPPPTLDQTLDHILAAGEPVQLPTDLLNLLMERRRRANRLAPWVEGHYRPGEPL